MTTTTRIGSVVSLTAGLTADVARRTLLGTVYRYGEVGQTSAGRLAVASSLKPPPIGLPLTEEHNREIVRGHVTLIDNTPERLRIAVRVVDGPAGDLALEEAVSRARAGFSFDLDDTIVRDGTIVSGRWIAVGQVADPAFNSARIDSVAASLAQPVAVSASAAPVTPWFNTPVASRPAPTGWPR